MRVNISYFSDFCFGVKRAIGAAEDALKRGKRPVYSLGAIIHNKEVVQRLSKKGIKMLKGGINDVKRGTIVISSHGVHPDRLRNIPRQIRIVDATCPFVRKAQGIAERLFREGYGVIIVGDKGHPEVSSLRRFAGGKAVIINNIKETERFKTKSGKIGIIAQTTQASGDFSCMVSRILKKYFQETRVFNTICPDAFMRQKSAEEIARQNSVVIVVGGKDSANTARLCHICKKAGARVYHIETAGEIKRRWTAGAKSVGIVSGASTPKWIVDEVAARLNECTKSR